MNEIINELISRYPSLSVCENEIEESANAMISCFRRGGKLMCAGNGGSAADAEHIVGELMKGFLKKRPLKRNERERLRSSFPLSEGIMDRLQGAVPAIALTGHAALTSAFLNDVEPLMTFAQQLYGYGREGDIFLGITTSGNSKNVCLAAELARAMKITVIGLTGVRGGRLADLSDICVKVPETETFKVQELHLPVYHCLCACVEDAMFDE